jgi:tol-pal system protein YbgF
MTRAGLRVLGVCAVALCATVAAGTVGASSGQASAARFVEPGGDASRYIRVAGLFGESDEERDARLQREQNQDDSINRLNQKVRDLEDSVRNLTGENEELNHRVVQLNDKIDRMQKDFEYRLCTMAAQQLGSSSGQSDPNAVPCGTSGGTTAAGTAPSGGAYSPSASPAPTAHTQSPDDGARGDGSDEGTGRGDDGPRGDTGGRSLASGPGVLGTLPSDSAGRSSDRPPPASESGAAGGDTRGEFSAAMNLLAKARYDEARAAFRSFADTHPKDDLTPQAVYWIGDIAYVQKDYDNATRAFAEVIKKYPNSVRAPDSMLKLGQALIAAGQKKEGCTALAALPAKYPKASRAVLDQGADARKGVCRAIS